MDYRFVRQAWVLQGRLQCNAVMIMVLHIGLDGRTDPGMEGRRSAVGSQKRPLAKLNRGLVALLGYVLTRVLARFCGMHHAVEELV